MIFRRYIKGFIYYKDDILVYLKKTLSLTASKVGIFKKMTFPIIATFLDPSSPPIFISQYIVAIFSQVYLKFLFKVTLACLRKTE